MGIREAEEATGISRQNIRFYEKQGLLHPARNKRNSYREYSDEDILRLKQIRLFRKLGMPLDEIRRLLDGEVDLMQALEEQERRLAVEGYARVPVRPRTHRGRQDGRHLVGFGPLQLLLLILPRESGVPLPGRTPPFFLSITDRAKPAVRVFCALRKRLRHRSSSQGSFDPDEAYSHVTSPLSRIDDKIPLEPPRPSSPFRCPANSDDTWCRYIFKKRFLHIFTNI